MIDSTATHIKQEMCHSWQASYLPALPSLPPSFSYLVELLCFHNGLGESVVEVHGKRPEPEEALYVYMYVYTCTCIKRTRE